MIEIDGYRSINVYLYSRNTFHPKTQIYVAITRQYRREIDTLNVSGL